MADRIRRDIFKAFLAGSVISPFQLLAAATASSSPDCSGTTVRWGRGIEGQRKADLGDGRYVNPIVPGDHPDPTILKDGDDYYMTFSSFNSYPGIVIWHSRDLVNWSPLGPALRKNIGTVWALDLCKYGDRYYIYIPAAHTDEPWSIYAIWADDINGPWSDPVNLEIAGCIDPGHVVGEDGKRYLFVNGIRKIRLNDDGLATDGELEHAYSPWRYPDDWIVENFAPEGPKLKRRGDWLYLVTAVGGTAGPPTGHMVIVARSRSVNGPWEHCPHNPLVRTWSNCEPWWSRGHASLVEGPNGDWWMVYHGYENGYRTLGRQTLLEPIEWTTDGWFRALGGDLSHPLEKPLKTSSGSSGFALSDDFSTDKFGTQWSFHDPDPDEMSRVRRLDEALQLAGRGSSPVDSSPLTCGVVDHAYRVEVSIDLLGDAEGGLLLFYNHRAFVGIGFTPRSIKTFQYAAEQAWSRLKSNNRSMRVRLTNDRHIVTFEYSFDGGKSWQLHPTRMEVSGLNHNVFGDFLSLKIGIYSAKQGQVQLRQFDYQSLSSPDKSQVDG
jgi:xylan 1,4-beta-xylosidase